MDYAKLELKLRKIVEKRLREGWLVTPGLLDFIGVQGGTCCVVGAIGIEANVERAGIRRWASDKLGFPIETLCTIENGFEDREHWDHLRAEDMDARAIGARIRRDYCEFEAA